MPTTTSAATRDGEALLHTVATAMVRLSQRRHPGDPVYEDVVQRGYDTVVLECLRRGQQPPGSVPDMVAWAADRPLHTWPLDLLDADVTDGQYLIDRDTRTPTQFCLEWALTVADPAAEKFENFVMLEAMAACRAARSPESYTTLRRLFISRPVLTAAHMAELSGDIDLVPVLDLVQQAYEPAAASYQHNGQLFTCRRCRCLLTPTTAGLRCELDRCLAEGNTTIGDTLDPHAGGGVRLLRRPLRMFITSPGLAETDLERQLTRLGLTVGNEETLVILDAHNSRYRIPWLQDGIMVPDLLQLGNGPAQRLSLYGRNLRLVRVRGDDRHETAEWWAPKGDEPAGFSKGLWETTPGDPKSRVFSAQWNDPASTKSSSPRPRSPAVRTSGSRPIRRRANSAKSFARSVMRPRVRGTQPCWKSASWARPPPRHRKHGQGSFTSSACPTKTPRA